MWSGPLRAIILPPIDFIIPAARTLSPPPGFDDSYPTRPPYAGRPPQSSQNDSKRSADCFVAGLDAAGSLCRGNVAPPRVLPIVRDFEATCRGMRPHTGNGNSTPLPFPREQLLKSCRRPRRWPRAENEVARLMLLPHKSLEGIATQITWRFCVPLFAHRKWNKPR